MTDLIPFEIDAQRVVQLLAKQIYQSPLALLRENTQNAFDAVRQRLQLDSAFSPRIDIDLSPNTVIITDNGLGMTPDDLKRHYWTAGSSSKNNDAARAAGVVGTFGIGAMANFGIAETLVVETESARTGERSFCRAERSRLSLREDCIELSPVESRGLPGTVITAHVANDSLINVQQARDYIADFVALIDIPVFVNGDLVSRSPAEKQVPLVAETWRMEEPTRQLGGRLRADTLLVVSNNADVWIHLTNIEWDGKLLPGRLMLRSGHPALRTFRSGFGLAVASVSSTYNFGGIADLLVLEPTAGREAITVDGLQLLQTMISEVDSYVSHILAGRDECDASAPFMTWVIGHGRYDLCSRLRVSVVPGDRIQLGEVSARSRDFSMMLYEGADQAIIKMHTSEDKPLLILARNNPRRQCEQQYLRLHAKVELVSDSPVVRDRRTRTQFSYNESALAFRIESILEADYFVTTVVEFGIISHGLPALAEKQPDGSVKITLNPEVATVKVLMGLYEREYSAFASMAKDFARNIIFPRIADFVPSSTRQGAEAFLKAIRRQRELFEYADDDLGNLPRIWEEYTEGHLSLDQAVERSRIAVRSSVQFVDHAAQARDVVPDMIENEQILQSNESLPNLEPAPAINRLGVSSPAKLLVIDEVEPAFRGYRCFVALSDKVREEYGEFFLQPHRTSIVWGGQKTLFVFLHHSGEFGLYYDLQTREPVDVQAGGGSYETATIVLKDRVFIPVPIEISARFIPKLGERKRFEVRADILRTEMPDR